MSMSTGDVRQPPGKLSAKAVAAGGKKPDAAGDPSASTPTDKGAGARSPAGQAGGSARAAGGASKPGGGASKPSGGASKPSGGASKPGGGASKPGGGASKAGSKVDFASKAMSGSRTGPVKAGGGKGRRPVAPIRVNQARNWGPILMFGGSGLVAVLIVGFISLQLISRPDPSKWRERAAAIPSISVFLQSNPDWFTPPPDGNHKPGSLTYPSTPPVGGTHNGQWQSCLGDVYSAEIPKEQAVHSMEHGAVWITYQPDLPQDQVERLAERVRGRSFLMMSPFPGLDKPISLQAWGYQLKLDNADDGRIDDFITELRQNATQEPQAGCQGGITDTGSVPLDLPVTQ